MNSGPQMALAAAPELGMTQRCTPITVAFATLLALPTSDLVSRIDTEVANNPALVRATPLVRCRVCDGLGCPACRGGPPLSTGCRLPSDIATEPSARSRLEADAAQSIHPADRRLLTRLVDSLDRDGLLRPADREALGASESQIDRVIAALRCSGECSIAACDPMERLLLQLEQAPAGRYNDLARRVIAEHSTALADGNFDEVATELGIEPAVLVEALAWMRSTLRPHPVDLDDRIGSPGQSFPDIAVFTDPDRPGRIAVEVLERRQLALRIDDGFRRMALQDAVVAAQINAAEHFVSLLDRRWTTLRRVAVTAVGIQSSWIRGRGSRRDLTRADVSRAIGCHESTVSRAVAGRSVMLPTGRTIPFAEMFQTGNGPKERIAALVAEESHALTDSELVAELTRSGYPVARRTVAKYRSKLGIPCASRRASVSRLCR